MKLHVFYLLFILFPVANLMSQIEVDPYIENVSRVPENRGGAIELKRFFDYHLVYPQIALKSKTEGFVELKFVITKEGKIRNVDIIASLSPETNAEALRLISLLEWNPALQGTREVDAFHTLKVPFSISKYKKCLKKRAGMESLSAVPIDTSMAIYIKYNEAPHYIYGKDSLANFIASEIEYPNNARIQSIQGTVTLSFVVETNGFISNLNVIKSLGGGCDIEACRVVGQTKWKPAVNDGKLVRSRITYPVQFKLQNNFLDNTLGNQRGN